VRRGDLEPGQGPQPIVLGAQLAVVRAKRVDLLIRGVEPVA
jgi:hypothetical protein